RRGGTLRYGLLGARARNRLTRVAIGCWRATLRRSSHRGKAPPYPLFGGALLATPSADKAERTLNYPSTTTPRRSCKQLPSTHPPPPPARGGCSRPPPRPAAVRGWLLRRPPSFRGRGTMAPLLARRSKGKQGRSRERSPPAPAPRLTAIPPALGF